MNTSVIDRQYNIGFICTRQQCEAGRSDKVAMRWISPALERMDYHLSDLEQASNRAANLLLGLGVQPGDRVFIFLPKTARALFRVFGHLERSRRWPVSCLSNFGEDALLDRLGDSAARVLITKKELPAQDPRDLAQPAGVGKGAGGRPGRG